MSAQDAGQQLKIVLKDSTVRNMRSDLCNSNIIATACSRSLPSTRGKGDKGGVSGIPSMMLKGIE